MERSQRKYWIDLAKGIAIFLVVLGHVLQMRFLNMMGLGVDVIYSFHMPLFIFLSGYVLKSLPDKANWGYITKKAERLLIPFFLWGSLNCILRREQYLNKFLFIGGNGYWYLWVLFQFALLLTLSAIIVKAFGKRKSSMLLTQSFVLILVFIFYNFIPDTSITYSAMQVARFCDLLPYFLAGYIAGQFNITSLQKPTVGFVGLVLFIACYICQWNTIPLAIYAIIFCVCTLPNIRPNKVMDRIAVYGKSSLAIYVLHWLLFGVFSKPVVAKITDVLNISDNGTCIFIFSFVISVIMVEICVVSSTFIRKIPYIGKYII